MTAAWSPVNGVGLTNYHLMLSAYSWRRIEEAQMIVKESFKSFYSFSVFTLILEYWISGPCSWSDKLKE